jgi:hypothetical protein
MTIDLTPLVQLAATLASAALAGVVPFVLPVLQKYLHVKLTAAQAEKITDAAARAAGSAYGFIVQSGASLHDVPIRNAAIGRAVNYVIKSCPEYLKDLGVTNEHIEAIVEAEFGKLLVTDQSVTIAPKPTPPPVQAPANVPAP